MRYMMLIYSQDDAFPGPLSETKDLREVSAAHQALMDETSRRGILCAADPLEPASTATTVRMSGGKMLITDGPFAETKEQIAGYYILDCHDLDEALEWAAKIPTACHGAAGYVEVRPIHEIRKPAVMNVRG